MGTDEWRASGRATGTFAALMAVAPRLTTAAFASALALAGCGGGERQDADEPSGTWTVDVVEADFPESQRLAKQEEMVIRVRNREGREIPNVAVTVDGLSRRSEQPGLADPNRPVWVIDDGPRGGVTAYTNTWALGKIPAGKTKTFRWRVTPVEPGQHELSYRVSAGLDGKAKARLAGGGRAEGRFNVSVTRKPSQSRVDPDSGEVIRE
jgi:hypothetical protein